MEVGADLFHGRELPYKFLGDQPGLQGTEPDPLHARDLVEPLCQLQKVLGLLLKVCAIGA